MSFMIAWTSETAITFETGDFVFTLEKRHIVLRTFIRNGSVSYAIFTKNDSFHCQLQKELFNILRLDFPDLAHELIDQDAFRTVDHA